MFPAFLQTDLFFFSSCEVFSRRFCSSLNFLINREQTELRINFVDTA